MGGVEERGRRGERGGGEERGRGEERGGGEERGRGEERGGGEREREIGWDGGVREGGMESENKHTVCIVVLIAKS